MKILHTSDWHLGHRLYNYDRSDEEARFFSQLAEVVGREQPDAMVISGDIFHTGAPGNDVAKVFTDRLAEVQAKCSTMETVVIAGNHDSYSRLMVDKTLWSSFRVHVLGTPAEDRDGKADFGKNAVEIGDKGVIAAVPFCHPRNFPVVEGEPAEDRQKEYFAGLAKWMENMAGERPRVLMAHLAVKGELDLRGHDTSLMVGGVDCVTSDELGTGYDYVALGHIHCPQWVKGTRECVRYCGTPRAIHFDETYDHGVDIVTVERGQKPSVRTVRLEPLRSLVTFGGEKGTDFEAALGELAESTLDAETYVRLNVTLKAGELLGTDWTDRARIACEAKGARYCTINPIRVETAKQESAEKRLTMKELKELSDDEVLKILTERRTLDERQQELLKEVLAELASEGK